MLLPLDAADDEESVQDPSLSGPEEQILTSWIGNTATWTLAVRRGEIFSRERVTNKAILEAIARSAPRTLLDLGCGEGWLAHLCALNGIEVLGIDAVAELTAIAADGAPRGARFQTLTYQEIAAGCLLEHFDGVVANFSLLGDRSLEELFTVLPRLLAPGGSVLVQTLHPVLACADQPYQDGYAIPVPSMCPPGPQSLRGRTDARGSVPPTRFGRYASGGGEPERGAYSHHQVANAAAWPQGWPSPSRRVHSRALSMRNRRPRLSMRTPA